MNDVKVEYIFSGKIQSYKIKEKEFRSGYLKRESCENAHIFKDGIKGDEQADARYHGGIDKALLIASTNHFKTYEEEFCETIDETIFSANILVNRLDESSVCVGDVYSIGSVQLQVTQPRQPCWKIGAIFSNKISKFIKQNAATGWYVKVLQEGSITLQDNMTLLTRKSDISIKEMTQYLESKMIAKDIFNKLLDADFVAHSYKDDIKKCKIV